MKPHALLGSPLRRALATIAALAIASSALAQQTRPAASGPLKPHPGNGRYFADATGRAVLLVGSHTWNNLLDMGTADPPPKFDFPAYLDFLVRHDHNFIRLWAWETVTWNTKPNRREALNHVAPVVWARTGPGKALDGKPKFDLTKFDPEYFQRLRTRIAAARDRGIYVSIMLFEGWAMQFAPDAWRSHPFHPDNNINGVNGDSNDDGKGLEVHELANPAVTRIQEAYVRKVVDTVNDLDNVLYEISNENHPPSTAWQYHVIEFIHKYEKSKPRQHPVGMTFQYKGGSNKALFDSPAEWVSPNPEGGYRDDPPAGDGRKVIVNDTDHLWGIGGNEAWVWKSFCRGMNPIFMDPYDGGILGNRLDPKWEPIRRAMGYALRYARRMDLAAMTPRDKLASTGYCLAHPAKAAAEYLVYLPAGGKVTVDLSAAAGELAVEWFDPAAGKPAAAARVQGGAPRELTAPFKGPAVVYIAHAR